METSCEIGMAAAQRIRAKLPGGSGSPRFSRYVDGRQGTTNSSADSRVGFNEWRLEVLIP
jgi:hypothetical protein